MRSGLQLLALVLATFLGGCTMIGNFFAGADNSAPPAPLAPLESSLPVQTLWSRDVGSGSDNQYVKLAPLVVDDKIVAADYRGRVFAYGAASGQTLWETETEARISGGPGSGEGLILVGTSEGEVIALNAEKGDIAWRARVSSEILAAPRADAGIVVVRTVDGKVFGLSATDGARIWVYEQSVPALTLRGNSAPLLADGRVIAGFASSKLTAISLNEGKLLWETGVAEPRGRTELERLVDISGEIQLRDATIYAASFQGRIAAVDLSSGRLLWARDMSSDTGIGIDDSNVYVSDAKGHVWALNRSDGSTEWEQKKLQGRALTAPTAQDDYVVVGDFEGYLHWLSREDGSLVARVRVDDDGVIAPPVAAAGRLYVSGKSGVLTALTTGER